MKKIFFLFIILFYTPTNSAEVSKKEWNKKATYDNGDTSLLYREPLEKMKKGYARYLRMYLPVNKRITDPNKLESEVEKEFREGYERVLWNDYKIAIKKMQIVKVRSRENILSLKVK